MRAPLTTLAAFALATALPAQFDWNRGSRAHEGTRYNAHFGDNATWGDFDGDSKLDYAIAEPGADAIHLYRGIDGFPLATLTGLTGSRMGTDLDAADFDHDGRDDIVAVSGRQFSHHLQVWFAVNWSAPALTVPLPSTGESRFSVAAWDHDDDGQAWIAVGSPDRSVGAPNSGWIGLYDLTATMRTGVFGAARYGFLGEFLTVGDLDGDDRDELFATESGWSQGRGHVVEFDGSLAMPATADYRSPFPTIQMGIGGIEVFENAAGTDSRLVVGCPADGMLSEGAIAIYGRNRSLQSWIVGLAADDRLGQSVAFDGDGVILATTANALTGQSEIFREDAGGLRSLFREASESLSLRGGSYPSHCRCTTVVRTHQILVCRPYANTAAGAYAGDARLIPTLGGTRISTTTNGVSAQLGGRLHWDMDVGSEQARGAFWPFLSLTGPGPIQVSGIEIWLTPDALTAFGSIAPATPIDATGRLGVDLTVPANVLQVGAAGRSLFFGGIGIDANGLLFGLPSHHACYLF